MLTFEEAQEYLTQVADELPKEIFDDLNGGITLSPELKTSPRSINNDLFILGQYHNHPRGLGRYVTIYYGSIARVLRNASDERWREKLKEVLHHELTHHLESKAGDKTLERQDDADYEAYEKTYYEDN